MTIKPGKPSKCLISQGRCPFPRGPQVTQTTWGGCCAGAEQEGAVGTAQTAHVQSDGAGQAAAPHTPFPLQGALSKLVQGSECSNNPSN